MEKLKPCHCGNVPFVYIAKKIGIPSGDIGTQVIVACHICDIEIKRWALKKSWALESAHKGWNSLQE